MWFLTVSVLRWVRRRSASSAALVPRRRPSTWRGVRCGGGAVGLLVRASLEQPEDADHPFTAHGHCRADLDGHPRAGG